MVLLGACTTAPGPQLSCGASGPNTYYFPAGTFAQRDDPDRLPFEDDDYDPEAEDRAHYSETLDYFGAASLSCGPPPADETYRLVWIRSFHPTVVIQVSRHASAYAVDVALPDEDSSDGKPLRHSHRTLSFADWSRLTQGLKQIDFWSLRPNDALTGAFRIPGSTDILVRTSGKDGARWIIEGRADRYHVVDRWSDDAEEVAVGRIFLDLAQLQLPEEDIY